MKYRTVQHNVATQWDTTMLQESKSCFMAKLMDYYVHINQKWSKETAEWKEKQIAAENPLESFSFIYQSLCTAFSFFSSCYKLRLN